MIIILDTDKVLTADEIAIISSATKKAESKKSSKEEKSKKKETPTGKDIN